MNPIQKNTIHSSGQHALGRPRLIIATLVALFLLAIAGGVLAQAGQLPDDPPDAFAGMIPYTDRCSNCHGTTGQGDGEMAPDLPNPPTAHASPEYLRAAIPVEMFELITNGRVDKGMPPFGEASSDPLSETSRWDLIAAIYSLGTPVEVVEQGQVVYGENCLACHGESGAGDGPEVDQSSSEPGDLSNSGYWFNHSNQSVFDSLATNQNPDHEFDLDDEALWSVIDYMRTFSYGYTDTLARFRPLDQAIVLGQVINGTTGDVLTTGNIARLRAFTQDLDITLEMEDTLDADGFFQFDLTEVPQDWFFRVSLEYEDIDFGSDFGQVTFDQPELNLPITVFDPATDPGAIYIEQLHLVLGFDSDQVLVSEVYIASNNDSTVFVGESGNANLGTFEISLPSGAQDVTFQRGFGSIDSFIPANEVIETGSGWADTLPLRPGPGSLTLVALYSLPYEDGGTISHPIAYNTGGVNLVIPDVGVALAGDNWQSGGSQSMGTGPVSTYGQGNLPAGSELILRLEGEPSMTGGASSTNVIRDNVTELLIGLAVAVGVIVIAVWVIRGWRQEPVQVMSREELLQELADLDDTFEAGEIDEPTYHREREEIKADLMAIWE